MCRRENPAVFLLSIMLRNMAYVLIFPKIMLLYLDKLINIVII